MQPVYRFAPSPNGPLHLGHAYAALFNHALARRASGRFLLRIEDIDQERCRPELEAAQIADLEWLGLDWDEKPRRQSEHFDRYRAALDRLVAEDLIYPAFMSRAEIRYHASVYPNWPVDPDGAPHYPGLDRTLSRAEAEARITAGAPYALRLRMDRAIERVGQLTWTERGAGPQGQTGVIGAQPEIWGDVILARRDTPTSYHLAVVLDDADQGVTDVVRGDDLFHATAVHRVLQRLLDLPEPAFRHHRLIRDSHGNKLSKSDRATGLAELRARGADPDFIRAMVGVDDDLAQIDR